ncbi:MAG: S49 family peptidase [Actinomycetota bacterium]|nr:S49 family peptidase [Actinomycetota bacterium]
MKYARIIAAVAGQPWAIEPTKGRAMAEFLAFAAAGGKVPAEDAKKLNPRSERKVADSPGAVAVIPIYGIMVQHAAMVSSMSEPAESSMDAVGRTISAAASDPEVKAIILRIESPGGSVYGITELADRILAAREQKPVIAQIDSYAASAAYWAASQATEVVVSPGGDVGSIGVYMLHEDISGFLDQKGIVETFVSAGKYKVEGNPFEPLGEAARTHLQSRVDSAYVDFLAAVSRGRGVDVDTVAERFGQGRMVQYDEAVRRGMADRVATLDETIQRFVSVASTKDRDARRARKQRELELAQLT